MTYFHRTAYPCTVWLYPVCACGLIWVNPYIGSTHVALAVNVLNPSDRFNIDGGDQRLLIIKNFSEYAQVMNAAKLAASGMTRDAHEIFTQRSISAGEDIEIDAYRYLWIDISDQ